MKQFDTTIDIEALCAQAEQEKAVRELGFNALFEQTLVKAIRMKYAPQMGNIPLRDGRVWYRIQKKLEGEKPVLELEDAEYDFIKNILLDENVGHDAPQYRLVMQYIEKIEHIETERFKKSEQCA